MNHLKIAAGVSILTLLAVLTTGCWTLSIHPIYEEEDLVYDETLVGVWGDPEKPDAESWHFFGYDEGKFYRLVIREGELDRSVGSVEDGEFEVHMVTLGGQRFLDLYPEDPEDVNEYFRGSVVNGHIIVRIHPEGGTIHLSMLDPKWLERSLDEGAVELDHERLEETILITAGTAKLQRFLVSCPEEAFYELDSLARLDRSLFR